MFNVHCGLHKESERENVIKKMNKMQIAHLKAINKWTGQNKVVN